jgi:hypothetical protein
MILSKVENGHNYFHPVCPFVHTSVTTTGVLLLVKYCNTSKDNSKSHPKTLKRINVITIMIINAIISLQFIQQKQCDERQLVIFN